MCLNYQAKIRTKEITELGRLLIKAGEVDMGVVESGFELAHFLLHNERVVGLGINGNARLVRRLRHLSNSALHLSLHLDQVQNLLELGLLATLLKSIKEKAGLKFSIRSIKQIIQQIASPSFSKHEMAAYLLLAHLGLLMNSIVHLSRSWLGSDKKLSKGSTWSNEQFVDL